MNKFINWLKKLFGIKAKPAKVEECDCGDEHHHHHHAEVKQPEIAEVNAPEVKHEEPKQEHVEVKEEVKAEKAE